MPDGPDLHLDVYVAPIRPMRGTLAGGTRASSHSNSELKEDRHDHGA